MMHFAERALSIALDEKVDEQSAARHIGTNVLYDFYRFSRLANAVFWKDHAMAQSRMALDIEEINSKSPHYLKDAFTMVANFVPTEPDGRQFVKLREPGLLIRFHDSGRIECISSRDFVSDSTPKIKHASRKNLASGDFNGLEKFVGKWLLANIPTQYLLDIQKQSEANDNAAAMAQPRQQTDNLLGAMKKLGIKFSI